MSFAELVMRASLWTGGGTLLAILLNAALGDTTGMLPASLIGAVLGSSAGLRVTLNRLSCSLKRHS